MTSARKMNAWSTISALSLANNYGTFKIANLLISAQDERHKYHEITSYTREKG
jgi:hypothetical protein